MLETCICANVAPTASVMKLNLQAHTSSRSTQLVISYLTTHVSSSPLLICTLSYPTAPHPSPIYMSLPIVMRSMYKILARRLPLPNCLPIIYSTYVSLKSSDSFGQPFIADPRTRTPLRKSCGEARSICMIKRRP